MSSDPWAGLMISQLVLLAIHGFLASQDTALNELNEAQLRHDAEEDDAAAIKLLHLYDRKEGIAQALRFCLLLNSALAGALAACFASNAVMARIPALEGHPTLTILLIVLLVALIFQLFASMLPRRIAAHHPERSATSGRAALLAIYTILRPLNAMLNAISKGLAFLFGVDSNTAQEEVTEEEIMMMVDMGEETGAIEATEKEMIENIFEFNNRSAEDVMTHRTDVTSIWVNDDHDTIMHAIENTGLSRFPVYDEDIDDIIGIMNARDYLLDGQNTERTPLRNLLREAFFVPETVQADVLLRDMQKRKTHMAIVVDEYGGVAGIVTMEDLLEEIVGNIYDEFDPQTEAEITKIDDDTWRISGSTPLDEITELLDLEVPEDHEYDTLGGLIFDQLTTIPNDGATPVVEVSGLRIQVESLAEHRVEHALVTRLNHTEQTKSETEHATEV